MPEVVTGTVVGGMEIQNLHSRRTQPALIRVTFVAILVVHGVTPQPPGSWFILGIDSMSADDNAAGATSPPEIEHAAAELALAEVKPLCPHHATRTRHTESGERVKECMVCGQALP